MTEKWATDAARLEKAATGSIFKATLLYEKKWDEGWSPEAISTEVQSAGGSIIPFTVRRRLAAMEVARANPRPSLEAAFAKAYAEENRATRGGFGTPVPPEDRRRIYLEGVVGEFDRLFKESVDLTDDELGSVKLLRDKCDEVLSGRRLKAV